jgi:predicted DNA-binding transcriptional regulator YafY
MAADKLEIMDDLLSEGKEIRDPDHFTELINKRLPAHERPIKKDMTNKLIRDLKEKADDKGIFLNHHRRRGYFYESAMQGQLRVFNNRVDEHEKDLLLIANCLFSLFPGSMLDQFSSLVNNKILSKQKPVLNSQSAKAIQLSNIHSDPGSMWIPSIIKALRDQDALDIEYVKPTNTGLESSKRTLSPYIIRQHQSEWYLIAYDHFSNHIHKTKIFKLSRIHQLSVSGRKYFIDKSFSAEDYFKYTIGIHHRHLEAPIKIRVKVLDNALYDNLKENPLHATQVVIEDVNKLIEIEVFDTFELESLLLSFGANMKVVSPVAIVKRIKERLMDALQLYK